MKLVGFNFNKISIEKFSDDLKDIRINTNINISEINSVKPGILKTKEELVVANFTFTVDYSPKIAKIELAGKVIISLDPKTSKEVLKQWKNKKIPENFKVGLFNVILKKSNIKSLQLEEEMNLPLHVPLPSLKKENN